MSRPKANAYTVGLVASVAMVLIAVAIMLVGSEQRIWEGHTSYRIHFSRTNGLAKGAPVRLNGLAVGSVTDMRFPADPKANYIEVKLRVVHHAAKKVTKDTVGRIQTLGLLGDKYIELTSVKSDAEPLAAHGLIRSIDPVDYEDILGQSGDIVSNAIEVTALLKQVLTDINNRSGLIGRLISDDQLGKDLLNKIDSTVRNLESATARIDDLLERIDKGRGAVGVLMDEADGRKARESLESLRTASADARDFMAKLNRGRGLLPRLVGDEGYAGLTLGNLQSSTTSIADIASKVRSGHGTLGKLIYDEKLYNDADKLVGGSGTGGFWRLLWRGVSFFLPPLPHFSSSASSSPSGAAAPPSGPIPAGSASRPASSR